VKRATIFCIQRYNLRPFMYNSVFILKGVHVIFIYVM